MRREYDEFKVGLTVTVVGILVVAILVFIGKWDTLFRATRTLEVRFHHTGGIQSLRVKDPVRVGGLNVGRVKQIWLQMEKTPPTASRPDQDLYVHVLAEIPADVQIYTDARISIGTKFVGEGGTLDIVDTGRGGQVLTSGQVIDGQPPAGLAQVTEQVSRELDPDNPGGLLNQIKTQLDAENAESLIAKIHKSVDDVNAVTAQVRIQLNEQEQASLLAKLQVVLDNLKAAMDTARKMIQESAPRVSSAVKHVDNTARRLDTDISVKVARELDKTDNATLLAKLHAGLSSAQSGMENLRVMTGTGRDMLTLNRDNLQAVFDNFAETSSHLKATAKELRRNPWRLLYQPDKPEAEYANLMESARAFSDAAGALDQANAKLKLLVESNPVRIDPNDPQLFKIREEIKKAFCEFEQAQKKLWEILKLKSL